MRQLETLATAAPIKTTQTTMTTSLRGLVMRVAVAFDVTVPSPAAGSAAKTQELPVQPQHNNTNKNADRIRVTGGYQISQPLENRSECLAVV